VFDLCNPCILSLNTSGWIPLRLKILVGSFYILHNGIWLVKSTSLVTQEQEVRYCVYRLPRLEAPLPCSQKWQLRSSYSLLYGLAYRWIGGWRTPGMGTTSSPLRNDQSALGPTHPPNQWEPRGSSHDGIKRRRKESNLLLLSTSDANKA